MNTQDNFVLAGGITASGLFSAGAVTANPPLMVAGLVVTGRSYLFDDHQGSI